MRFKLLYAVAAAVCAAEFVAVAPGFAQQPSAAGAAANSGNSVLEEVVVTGSRIKAPENESPTPVVVVNQKAIEASGVINIADQLRTLPGVGTSGFSNTNTNFATSGAGANTINLRNLGDQRTLVLVNGRRFPPGIAGTSIVDFNLIPTDFIDHIDIVTGGASGVYGSDAIAGVVNVVYKDNFEGVRFRGQAGQSSKSDAQRYLAAMTVGSSLADGRGHFMLNVTYDKDKGLFSRDRARSAHDIEAGGAVGKPDGTIVSPFRSSFAPQGRFDVLTPSDQNAPNGGDYTGIGRFTFNPDNSLHAGFSQNGSATRAPDGFDRNQFRRIAVPVDRALLATSLNYNFTDHHQGYAELTYGITRAKSDLEPFPFATNNTSSSLYNYATDPAFSTPDNPYYLGMPITNAYLQTLPALAPIATQIAAWNVANPTNPVQYIQFRKRLLDVANRGNDERRQTMRVVVGAKGDLPFGRDWTYDSSYMFGRTTESQFTTGQVNYANMRYALDSIVDPGSGTIVCRDAVARSFGCVPINVFGYNSITPAAANYVSAGVTQDITIQEQVISGFITGPLFKAPAGDVSMVFGAEGRKDSSSAIWDSLTNLGLNGNNALPNSEGSITSKEVFVEFNVPLLKGVPGADSLSARAAARSADYSTVGRINTWNFGLEWAPISDLRLRATYASAVRAPNISELYGGKAETFPTLSDPCDGITTATAATYGAFAAPCLANPRIAAAAATAGGFAYTQAELQGVNGFNVSNPSLKQETAKTKSVGLVVQPRAWRGFSATVDWYDIKIDDAVGAIPRDSSVTSCLLTGQPVYCENVIRSAVTGKVLTINALLRNLGTISTSGIETVVRYAWNLGWTGANDVLDIRLAENHLTKLEQVSFPGAAVNDNLGELYDGSSQTRLGAGFKDRATLTLDYTHGPLQVNWSMNYLSSIKDTLDPNAIVDKVFNNVPAFWYNDVQVRYSLDLSEKSVLGAYLGAKNVFDKQPPVLPSGLNSEITGTETAADTYDVFGRFIYAGFDVKF